MVLQPLQVPANFVDIGGERSELNFILFPFFPPCGRAQSFIVLNSLVFFAQINVGAYFVYIAQQWYLIMAD